MHMHNGGEVAAPPDVFNILYVTYFLLGVSLLLPYSALVTAVDYNDRDPRHPLELLVAVWYLYSNFASIVLVVVASTFLGLTRVSPLARVAVAIVMFFTALLAIPLFGTTAVTLGAAVAFGMGDALLQGTLYTEVGGMAPRFTQAVQSGTAAAGLITAGVRVVTKASFADNRHGLVASTLIYYSLACALLALSLGLYIAVVRRSLLYRFFAQKTASTRGSLQYVRLGDSDALEATPSCANADGGDRGMPRALRVMNVVWPQCLAVFVSFAITMTVFPGVTTTIEASSPLLSRLSFGWYQVVLVAWFSVTSFAGKTLPGHWLPNRVARSRFLLLGLSCARVVFVPLILLMAGSTRRVHSDVYVFVVLGLFSFTDGFVGTAGMMIAPELVQEHADKSAAGLVSSLFLIGGLTFGVTIAWVVPWVARAR
eukprot:Amastigsp_a175419_24.p1 type:complete len:426 gc:universal Amastigsp_a175419_24:42-1319(+)